MRAIVSRRVVAAAALAALAGACGGGADAGTPDAAPIPGATARCDGTDEAFVRSASLAVLGRRPLSQDEVGVYVGLMDGVRANTRPFVGGVDPREVVVRAMARSPEFVERWAQIVMDALRVQRIDDQSMQTCYGAAVRAADGGELAAAVRDNGPHSDDGTFTMLDLLRSALRLDDLTPVLRAHLFAMMSRPIPAANVPRVQAELARRDDFGNMFDAAYLHRDIVCLGCHNSEGSVTFSPDPALNRHWAIPGLVEASLYGQSNGIDPAQAHAVFRYDGFVADPFGGGSGERPWGWSSACGELLPDGLETDPAGIEAHFGPIAGMTPTVYDLEGMLHRGVDKLAQDGGITVGPEGEVLDADTALAWLVAASLSEAVWREVIGSPLTIANYFPRNQAARDVLWRLTSVTARSHFSLEDLLVEIALTPYFNPAPPAAGCGDAPYALANVYNPWVIGEGDPTMRMNSSADGVHPLAARTLWSAAYAALEWSTGAHPHVSFPEVPLEVYYCLQGGFSCSALETYCQTTGDCCTAVEYCNDPSLEAAASEEQVFQRGVGAFLKNGERGFAGLDFQARLVWEQRFGACANPGPDPDFISGVVTRAQADPGATLRDVVQAIKDRIVGEPDVEDAVERAPIEALFGATLEAPAPGILELENGARRFCGVLVSSPQFVLGGLPSADRNSAPRLTPSSAGFDAVCADVSQRVGELSVTCASGFVEVSNP
jgi:hypothetical protein